jgi:UDP-N-acetylglucosamine/UDP-N-acetylgalactosamine diphosphorylase
LRFANGSPAIHIFDVEFLARVLQDESSLPFHLAKKKVPYLDESGKRVEPEKPNALKFEKFIFDVLPFAGRWTVALTSRDEEFAPLKNDSGPDSPETVRQALIDTAARWLRQAEVAVPEQTTYPLEISPLFALDAEELKEKLPRGYRIAGSTHLE